MSANLTPMTWSDYVRHTIGKDQQVDAARKAHVDQTTISRWVRGGQAGKAENVVKFARAYNRPVLEALVIAGFISEAEAKARVSITQYEDPTDDELLALLERRLRQTREENRDATPMTTQTPPPTELRAARTRKFPPPEEQ